MEELSDVFHSQFWESYSFIYPLSQYKRLHSAVLRWTDVDPDDSWIATKMKHPKDGLSNEGLQQTDHLKCRQVRSSSRSTPKQCNRN